MTRGTHRNSSAIRIERFLCIFTTLSSHAGDNEGAPAILEMDRGRIVKRLRSTSFRTFVLYPLVVFAWEWLSRDDGLSVRLQYVPLMVWGFLQYRLTGAYRIRLGGGGPGMDTPPERLVTSGPFVWCRNPMYLGHIVFLIGLALTFDSWFAALITVATGVWFQFRVRRDEMRLRERFGRPYEEYSARVRRWIPGLF
jgi:protein-S-isoprenylcysteine O-methyltransferase Ste14